MKSRVKQAVRGVAAPVGRLLARLGVSADAVTLAGVVAAGVAAWGFYTGDRALSFGGLLASGLCDLLDGAVARSTRGGGTRFGAALDSTLDRYGEGLILGAILARQAQVDAPAWLWSLALFALIGSFMVSYVRARSEGLGIACEVGLLERPERLLLLLILSLWGRGGMPWILGVLAVLSHLTFLHRLVHVRREAGRRAALDSGGGSGCVDQEPP